MNLKANSQELQDSALFKALLSENIKEFNQLRESGETASFEEAQLRGLDLRDANLEGLNFQGAYLRNSDLRGLDLRKTNLRGASIREAKLSGVYFPPELGANEILMSFQLGSRLRYTPSATED